MIVLGWDIGIKNLSYCLIEYTNNTELYNIHSWGIVDLRDGNDTKCKKISLSDLGNCLKKELDVLVKEPYFDKIDHVVCENQPVLKNPTMKSVQMLVFSYFLFRGNDVSFLNASNKLKVCKLEIDPEKLEKINKLKSKYSRNKKIAILHTELLLNDQNQDLQWKNLFSQSKKKDDLADSYLMSCFYIKKHASKSK